MPLDVPSLPPYVVAKYTRCVALGSCSSGGGRNSIRSTTENIETFAPMPRASVSTTPSVKPGLFASVRTA